MALDLQAGDEVVAALLEPGQDRLIEMPGRERHRPPIGEIDVTQQPSGRGRPGQHAKTRGIWHHQHVGGALHFRHAEAAAGGEDRKHRAVRRVLGEHRGGDGAAALQRGDRRARHQRLAAQDAVLVGERKPDDFELLLLDDARAGAPPPPVARSTTDRDARQNSTRHSLRARPECSQWKRFGVDFSPSPK